MLKKRFTIQAREFSSINAFRLPSQTIAQINSNDMRVQYNVENFNIIILSMWSNRVLKLHEGIAPKKIKLFQIWKKVREKPDKMKRKIVIFWKWRNYFARHFKILEFDSIGKQELYFQNRMEWKI